MVIIRVLPVLLAFFVFFFLKFSHLSCFFACFREMGSFLLQKCLFLMPVGGFKGLGRENSNKKSCPDFAENQVYCKKVCKKVEKIFFSL